MRKSGETDLLNWSFFLRDEHAYVRASARQINLSDNRLHQKPPERGNSSLKKINTLLNNSLLPKSPCGAAGLRNYLHLFSFKTFICSFPTPRSAPLPLTIWWIFTVQWNECTSLFFFLISPCVCMCLFSSSHCKFKQRRED